MKVFEAAQVRMLDLATIKNEPISSINLMERAANQIFKWIINKYDKHFNFYIFCGKGNNGGDGLALARMLIEKEYSCKVFLFNDNANLSDDAKINLNRLEKTANKCINYLKLKSEFPDISKNTVIIDAIFGSGINRYVTGLKADIINEINKSKTEIISIDIPSGLFAEDNSENKGAIVEADYTLSFEAPFLSFFFSENDRFLGNWEILNINLHEQSKNEMPTPYYFVEIEDIKKIIRPRQKFSHKGSYGHAFLISGMKGKAGAAILSAKACLRGGCGLLTCQVPKSAYEIMQTSCPEAMLELDENENYISEIKNTEKYSAIGMGPGIGTQKETTDVIKHLIKNYNKPMVFDADALNILAENKYLLKELQNNTILTPHTGEFKRLFDDFNNSFEALQIQIQASKKYNIIIVHKGAHTVTTLPNGDCYFNSTGNPGMATAGSGDVLTGIILSLLSQSYKPEDAAVAGVFIHALSADIAIEQESEEWLIASDIASTLGKAFRKIKEYENQIS
ncbi:MAG: NAD(P)H-hydrate dehydratase [Bacteroidales bacterium]|nr:NAD(P)H-hydrate dehydratase [Bacteroidales bacterium]